MRRVSIFFCLSTFLIPSANALEVGISAVDISPWDFETRPVNPADPFYKLGQKYYDTGTDRQFDYEEPGAFGPDGKPGIAGVDDDGDGIVDNCSRDKCDEYMAEWSDDVADPNHDNYDPINNPLGTEGDGIFEYVAIGGFNPYYPLPFLQNRLAVTIHDQIWSRAIAIRGDNGTKMLLISNDLPGLTWKHINPVRREIEKVFGIPFSNIVIASTHDHAAPDAAGYWSTSMPGHNKWYTDKLRKWMFQAATNAIRSMKPALMKTITTTHIACYNETTHEWKKQPNCNIAPNSTDYKADPTKWDAEAVQMDKRDPKVGNTLIVASQFIDKDTGATIGTFINWHNHPDTLDSTNQQISSDFPNYLRGYVEAELGGTAVYFTGTLGCQIGGAFYVPYWDENRKPVFDAPGHRAVAPQDVWDKIRSIGYEVGSEVVKALREKNVSLVKADAAIHTEQIDIAPVNFLHVLATHSVWKYDVEPEDEMHMYGPRCLPPRGCVRSDVSLAQIGDMSLITAPGEIDPVYFVGRKESTADYGKHGKLTYPAMPGVRDLLPGPHRAVLGEANNYLSYLLPQSDNVGWWNFSHPNHYEEFVTVNKHFGDDVGNKWMQMLGNEHRYNKRKILP